MFITKEELNLLFSLLPLWVLAVPTGLDPTFYGTGSYEGDLKVQQKVKKIKEKSDKAGHLFG